MNKAGLNQVLNLALTGALLLGTTSLIFAQRPSTIPQGGKRPDGVGGQRPDGARRPDGVGGKQPDGATRPDGVRPDNAPKFPRGGNRGGRP